LLGKALCIFQRTRSCAEAPVAMASVATTARPALANTIFLIALISQFSFGWDWSCAAG
jgi:hypothetical protein